MAAIGLSAAAATVQAATTPRLAIAVHVGYHDTIKLSEWMPVTVDITNNGASLDGILEVQSSNSGVNGPPTGSVIYQAPVSLATGASKHLRTYVLQDQSGTVAARVVESGRVVGSQEAFANNTTAALIGILSDQPTSLDALAAVQPGGIAATVAHMSSQDLPDSGLVLRAFDLLAIDDFATDTLTAGQRSALGDYVVNGGSLLLGTGGTWHKTLAGLPAAIVPIQVTGTTMLSSSQSLGGLSGVEVATGTLAGGRAWLSEGDQPLLVEKQIGEGMVAMSTFDWNQDPIAGWSGTAALLRQASVRSNLGVGSNNGSGLSYGTVGGSVAQRGGTLSQVLTNLPALDLPAWWVIGSLVFLYVVLVGPVNYFALRALNRRALSWITVPTIALVAAGGAYGAATLTKGRSVQANQVSIIHVETGWDRAYQESYTGVLTPTRGDYQVSITGGRSLTSPIGYYMGGFPDASQGLIRVDTTTDAITLPGMTAFSLRGFATEGQTSAPQLVGHAQVVNGALTGTIQNHSSLRFNDAVMIAGNSYQRFGQIAPGASVSFNLTPSVVNPFTGPPASAQIYPNGLNGTPNSSTDAERQAETKSAILSMLPVSGFKGFALSVVPMFVAWTDQPFQDITVGGAHPRSFNETAVVLMLPVGEIGAGPLPAGVVAGRLVDVVGDTQQNGLPGTVTLLSGSVTFEFTPSIVSGNHLSGVSVSSSNPFGAKGLPPASNGTTANVKGQVWDWSQSAWVDVSYQDNGSTTLPDTGVNPVTGEVRLKLSSDSAFSTGWLSLAGTVR